MQVYTLNPNEGIFLELNEKEKNNFSIFQDSEATSSISPHFINCTETAVPQQHGKRKY